MNYLKLFNFISNVLIASLFIGCQTIENSTSPSAEEKIETVYSKMLGMENQDFANQPSIAINETFSAWSVEQREFWSAYGDIVKLYGPRKAQNSLAGLIESRGSSFLLASSLGKQFFSDEALYTMIESGELSSFWKKIARGGGFTAREAFLFYRNQGQVVE
jgi:hypothetical protein